MKRKLFLALLIVYLMFSKDVLADCKLAQGNSCYNSEFGYASCTANGTCTGTTCPGGSPHYIQQVLTAQGKPCPEQQRSWVTIGVAGSIEGFYGTYETRGAFSGIISGYGSKWTYCDGNEAVYDLSLNCAECEMQNVGAPCYDEQLNHAYCFMDADCDLPYCFFGYITIVAESGNDCPQPAICTASTIRVGKYLDGSASCVAASSFLVFDGSGYISCDGDTREDYRHYPCP